jgi:hypothetical protein
MTILAIEGSMNRAGEDFLIHSHALLSTLDFLCQCGIAMTTQAFGVSSGNDGWFLCICDGNPE